MTALIMRDATRLSCNPQIALDMSVLIVEKTGCKIIYSNPGEVLPELIEGSLEQERLFNAYRLIDAAIKKRRQSAENDDPEQD